MPKLDPYTTGIDADCISIDEARRVVFHLLKVGFELMKANNGWLDRIFPHLSDDERDKMREYFSTNDVNVIHGYARKDAKLPLVSIITLNENTEQSYLNDHLAIEYAQDINPAFLGEVNPFRPQASIVSGGRVNIQLEVWVYSDNPDVTQYLYTLCWVFIHCARDILGKRGITAGDMSGGDVRPNVEMAPEFVYVRRIVMPMSGDRSYGVGDDLIQELVVRVNASLRV